MNFELRNSFSVIPAKAGIQNLSAFLDPRVKPEDDKRGRFVIQSNEPNEIPSTKHQKSNKFQAPNTKQIQNSKF